MHAPVMVDEVCAELAPRRGGVFVDCTVGLGGHAQALLDGGATRLIGLDRDEAALAHAASRLAVFGNRVELVHADYRTIGAVLGARSIQTVDGVLADLGVSSMQLDEAGRGFTFRRDEPLDMRMDRTSGMTAAEAIAGADERTLADVIFRYGEERHARRVARSIVAGRAEEAIATTGRLADLVRRAIPRRGYTRIDPATRTFQAIRIWVNHELEGLDTFLGDVAARLGSGGRMAIISFHSLEDRIVKHTLRALQARGEGLIVRTRRPLTPGADEMERNPRARSAKLRAAEQVGTRHGESDDEG
jgi:16S rRNA (cytosine1402-N4)-methyltransferase